MELGVRVRGGVPRTLSPDTCSLYGHYSDLKPDPHGNRRSSDWGVVDEEKAPPPLQESRAGVRRTRGARGQSSAAF